MLTGVHEARYTMQLRHFTFTQETAPKTHCSQYLKGITEVVGRQLVVPPMIFSVEQPTQRTGNSAIADKPRDAFVQTQWRV